MTDVGSDRRSVHRRPPQGGIASLVYARSLWRVAFWVYLPTLFTATHWPRLELNVPFIERPDLLIHFGAFGVWCALFILAGFIKPFASIRAVVISALIAAAYAGFDEGSQVIPFVHRNAAWDDWFANLGGVTLGALFCLMLFALARRGRASIPPISNDPQP